MSGKTSKSLIDYFSIVGVTVLNQEEDQNCITQFIYSLAQVLVDVQIVVLPANSMGIYLIGEENEHL